MRYLTRLACLALLLTSCAWLDTPVNPVGPRRTQPPQVFTPPVTDAWDPSVETVEMLDGLWTLNEARIEATLELPAQAQRVARATRVAAMAVYARREHAKLSVAERALFEAAVARIEESFDVGTRRAGAKQTSYAAPIPD